MGKSITDIKEEICQEFMRNEKAAERYGFTPGSAFGDFFSSASIENIMFYVWAVCAWSFEQLLGCHKREVSVIVEEIATHRPKWYRDKVLAFMADKELIPDSDGYDISGLTESDIKNSRVVKHCVAMESRDASLLIVKVAGENGGIRTPISDRNETQLLRYLSEIKDAGVRISLVNMEADQFNCSVDIYYNALLNPEEVKRNCESAIKNYIENLPFNGEYTNMALVDTLQEIDGVRIVELQSSSALAANQSTTSAINARLTPAAGYFKPGDIIINMRAYDE